MWKRLIYHIRCMFHSHSFSKEVELAGMDYWPFEHIKLKVCICGATRIEELK